MTGVRVGVGVGVSVGVVVEVSVGVWAFAMPVTLGEASAKNKTQVILYANKLLIFMMLFPFYDLIYRKGIIREPDNFIRS